MNLHLSIADTTIEGLTALTAKITSKPHTQSLKHEIPGTYILYIQMSELLNVKSRRNFSPALIVSQLLYIVFDGLIPCELSK